MAHLTLFPTGFEGTLLVPVLIGALVMTVLHEWWGWSFVGVVVPGYLCSVLTLEPVVAAVVVVEAVAAWALARALDALGVRAGLTYPVFGRDRFMLVLLCSLAVRLAAEMFALQALAAVVAPRFPALAGHRNELFGIGLVLVPLTANRLWRPGLRSGLFELAVQIALVSGAVMVLSKTTNFSLGGFELAYDHLALSFLSSPQAQITLLVTAALASALNRRYGWDFHGILVPALLALAIATPIRFAATFVEALLVMGLASAVLRLPWLRDREVEGPRAVVLCFAVGFAVKMVLAAAMSSRWPGYRPTDFFGFGYLLPSLLAERLLVRGRPVLALLPAAQTAVVGLLLAVGAARTLAAVAPAPRPATAAAAAPTPPPPASLARSSMPTRTLALAQVEDRIPGDVAPSPALVAVAALLDSHRRQPESLATALVPFGMTVTTAANGPSVITGQGVVVVLRPAAHAVVASAHRREVGTAAAALWAADLVDADCVLARDDGGSAPVLAAALHNQTGRPLLVVRGVASVPGGDALFVLQPVPRGTPSWLAGTEEALAARLRVSTETGIAAAPFRAFPPQAGRLAPAALLWLGPRARRLLAGNEVEWVRGDLEALAASRGVRTEEVDLASWVAAGQGAPAPRALAALEGLARTRDVARLLPAGRPSGLVLLVDEVRGLAAAGLEQGSHRGASVLGRRLERREAVGSVAEASRSLAAGARTLVARPAR
jgi:hypothetical protein